MTASSHLHVPQFASLRRMASFSKRAPTPEPAPVQPSIQGILLLEPVDVDASLSLDFNKPLPAPPPPRAVSPAPAAIPRPASAVPPARGTIALLEPITFAAPLAVDFTVSRIPRPSNASADGRMPALPSTQTKTTIVSRKRVPVPLVEPAAPKLTPVVAPAPPSAPAISLIPTPTPVKAEQAPAPAKLPVTPLSSPSKKSKSTPVSSPFKKAKSSSSPTTSPKKKTGTSSLIISKPIAIPARVESPLERPSSPPPRKAPTPPAVVSPIKRASSPAAAPKPVLSLASTPERVPSPAPRKDMGSATSSLKPARANLYMPGPPPKPVRSSSRPEPLEAAAAAALRQRTRALSAASSTTTLSSYSSDEALSALRDSQDGEETPATTMSPGASDIEDTKLPRGRTSSSSYERPRRSSSTPPKPPSSFRGAPVITPIVTAKDDSSPHVNLYALPARPGSAKRASSTSGIARTIRKRTSLRRLFTAPLSVSGRTSEEEPATPLDDDFEFVARGDACANGAPLRGAQRRVLLVSAPAETSELVAFDAVRGYCEAWGKVSTIARASAGKGKKDRSVLRLRVEFRDPTVCERVLAEAGDAVTIPDVGRVALALVQHK